MPPPESIPSHLLRRLLFAIGSGGLFAAGFAAGRGGSDEASVGAAPSASDTTSEVPAASASSPAYERQKPGTYPPPPDKQNACYAAGTKTAPLPCVGVHDPQLPMLIGQCLHPASNIQEGPVLAQYAGSPAVLCCYKADSPNCSGRPLLIAGLARFASLEKKQGWSAAGA